MEKVYLSCQEAARYVCISKSKLWKMCCKNEIKYYKVGRLNVFKKEDLDAYIESNKVETVAELQLLADATLINVKQK